MDKKLLRTQYAARAATLADQFRGAVEASPVGQHRGEMTAPEASTGGGIQSLQHIRLVPRDGKARTHVVGNANRIARVAELRTFEYVESVSLARFSEPSGLDAAAYRSFLDVAQQFLEMFGLTVTRVAIPPAHLSNRPPPSPPPRTSMGVLVLLALLLVAGGVGLGLLAARLFPR
jgi:hypothetical protein